MRPWYQKPIDVERENASVEVFSQACRLKDHKNILHWEKRDPTYPFYSPDFLFWLEQFPNHKFILEVKGRGPKWKGMDTWFISLKKMRVGWNEAHARNTAVYLIFTWGVEVWGAYVKETDVCFVTLGGNLKRNDGQGDIEEMAHFKKELFDYLGDIPKHLAVKD